MKGSTEMKQAMTEIAGNRELCSRLATDILSGSLSHAYILEGAHGSGRKTLALNVAAATACDSSDFLNNLTAVYACFNCILACHCDK